MITPTLIAVIALLLALAAWWALDWYATPDVIRHGGGHWDPTGDLPPAGWDGQHWTPPTGIPVGQSHPANIPSLAPEDHK